MRIITWNCNLSLGRKIDTLLALNPDVAIIQECEREFTAPSGYSYLWCGQNVKKGLGVLSRDKDAFAAPDASSDWTYFLPATLPNLNLKILAVWAYNHRAAKLGATRTGYPRNAISQLAPWLSSGRSIVAGDFNNWAGWDKPGNPNGMREVATQLKALGLTSAYHGIRNEHLGQETTMTHYFQKNDAKGFHIDYCFLHESLKPLEIEIPQFQVWRKSSDHVPFLTVTSDA